MSNASSRPQRAPRALCSMRDRHSLWPVVADSSVAGVGKVAIGGGGRGVNLHLDADALLGFLGAEVSDVTKGPRPHQHSR